MRSHKNGKVEFVHKLRKKVKIANWEEKFQNCFKSNKGPKIVIFKLEIRFGCILLKKKNSTQRKSKILPREDRSFQVLEHINKNVYKIDLSNEYGVNATFNVLDLSSFDVDGS